MENSKNLIDWSIVNKKTLDLNVTYFSGISSLLPNFYDIGVDLTLEGTKYHGRGTHKIEEIAYSKAIAESLERFVASRNKISNTNGLAAHPILNKAKEIARNELIERDAFLCNFLLCIKPNSILSKSFDFSISKRNFPVKVVYYELLKSPLGHGVMALLDGFKDFFCLGIAFCKTLDESVEKATVELFRDFTFLINLESRDALSIEQFHNLKEISFYDHSKLTSSHNYSEAFLNSLNLDDQLDLNTSQDVSDFSYQCFESEESVLNCPLFFVLAQNTKLQHLFCGPTYKENLNFERLSNVFGRTVLFDNINKLPHPIN